MRTKALLGFVGVLLCALLVFGLFVPIKSGISEDICQGDESFHLLLGGWDDFNSALQSKKSGNIEDRLCAKGYGTIKLYL